MNKLAEFLPRPGGRETGSIPVRGSNYYLPAFSFAIAQDATARAHIALVCKSRMQLVLSAYATRACMQAQHATRACRQSSSNLTARSQLACILINRAVR